MFVKISYTNAFLQHTSLVQEAERLTRLGDPRDTELIAEMQRRHRALSRAMLTAPFCKRPVCLRELTKAELWEYWITLAVIYFAVSGFLIWLLL